MQLARGEIIARGEPRLRRCTVSHLLTKMVNTTPTTSTTIQDKDFIDFALIRAKEMSRRQTIMTSE